MLVFSSQIYPELPAALLILVALRVMVRWASSPLALAFGSTAAALLVWLHGPLHSPGVRRAARTCHRRVPGSRQGAASPRPTGPDRVGRAAWGELALSTRVLAREWRTVTVPLAVPFVAYLAIFAAVSYHLYGTAHPTAPYDAFYDTTSAPPAGRSCTSSLSPICSIPSRAGSRTPRCTGWASLRSGVSSSAGDGRQRLASPCRSATSWSSRARESHRICVPGAAPDLRHRADRRPACARDPAGSPSAVRVRPTARGLARRRGRGRE